mmetsp:Transcript_25120/g.25325  ORF Transcript_25120/g.25325 Transcript_25120/m.25325 type:complete len:145 (-) Transcript_25120:154-588(-)
MQKLSVFVLIFTLNVCGAFFHSKPIGLFKTSKRSACAITAKFKNFDDMLEKLDVPVLVDFYAQWCGPCVMMQPILEDVAQRLENEARVAKVDTDKSPKLGSRYEVEALPTLILFYKGKEVERFIGYSTADELEKQIRQIMKNLN